MCINKYKATHVAHITFLWDSDALDFQWMRDGLD